MPVLVLANKQDLPTAVDLPGLEKGEIVDGSLVCWLFKRFVCVNEKFRRL